MPVKSAKQRKLMQAVMHNKEFAHKVGISQAVAKEMLNGMKHEKSKRKGKKK